MALNIKNERVHHLAREAARRTGATQTGAIEAALERYVNELTEAERRDSEARSGRLAELLADTRQRLKQAGDPALSTEDLYDEHGLPA